MSINSRYRERKYNSSENDRLLRALAQPVQAWDKKWTSHADTKKLAIYKWVKSERTIHFEPDEESEDEAVEMDQDKEPLDQDTTETPPSQQKTDSFNAIPGGHSSLLQSAMNKTVSTLQMEEDERSHTPNLDDISDVESDRNLDDDNDNDVDSVSDPSKHPALAPHAQAHMTDDDMMTDSSVATPADERADQVMEEAIQHPHPLSQEPISAEPSAEFASSSTTFDQAPLAPVTILQPESAPLAPSLQASSTQEASFSVEKSTPESSIQEQEPMVDDPMQEDPPQVDQQQEEQDKEDQPRQVSQERKEEINPQEETMKDTIDQTKSDEAPLPPATTTTPENVTESQDSSFEPTKVTIQEPTQEATQEITLEPAQQITQETPQEPASESTLDSIQTPQQAVDELVKTPQEEEVQEKANETIQEAPQEQVETPKEEAPKEEVPNEEVPNEEAPKEEVPIEEAPNEEAPNEEAPNEEAPKEEAPKEEVPNEDTPSAEVPVQEEVPKEETPSEEASALAIPTFNATSPKDVAAVADANTTVGLPANVEAPSTDEKQEPVTVVTDEPMEH